MAAASTPRRATLVLVTLLLGLALSRPAQGALPPAFGGVAVLLPTYHEFNWLSWKNTS